MISETPVGQALDDQITKRSKGIGAPNVHSKLRLFPKDSSTSEVPQLTLYRDHAGWCPYCQKTMLLVEAKRIPIKIELVNMRSYGDKPAEFLRKVPGGLLPALEVEGRGVITESAVIMQLLDEWHSAEDGYTNQMVPDKETQPQHYKRYQSLMRLERELFRWWCTLVFRPENGGLGGGGNPFSNIFGGEKGTISSSFSPSLRGFLECLQSVNDSLGASSGPYFLDYTTKHPTMIDFVFASHVERMLASVAYWKGIDLRDSTKWSRFSALQRWFDALERQEYYLAFKSDYYTHVKDIPPQYGPGYDGITFPDEIRKFQASILGRDGKSWTLPLQHDDELQPLYRGPPLPLCVLEAAGIKSDDNIDDNGDDIGDGSYLNADPRLVAMACRQMAAWKLVGNGPNISKFSSRGGPKGAKNPRKSFGAELADPYAESDTVILDTVDVVLRVTAIALQDVDGSKASTADQLRGRPDGSKYRPLLAAAMQTNGPPNAVLINGVISSLEYLRDRVGVPRDLPLASARYLRAYLNWTIDELQRGL